MALLDAPALPLNALRLVVSTMSPSDEALRAIVEGTHLNAVSFYQEDGHLTWSELHCMVSHIIALNPEPGLALQAGRSAGPSIHGAMGIAAMTSGTLGEALGLFSKYMSTRSQIFAMDYEQNAGDFSVMSFDFLPALDDVLQFMMESILASAFTCAQALLGKPLDGSEVHFVFAEPDYIEHFHLAFPGCVLRFNAPCNAIYTPRHYSDCPLMSKDRHMQSMAMQQCEAMRGVLKRQGSIAEIALRRLQEEDGHGLSLDALAEQMNLSRRTLLRRLKDEGTSYQTLYDSAISRRAVFLIGLPGSTVAAVAAQLGYAEPVSFRRAFRRWFGVTPSEYRVTH